MGLPLILPYVVFNFLVGRIAQSVKCLGYGLDERAEIFLFSSVDFIQSPIPRVPGAKQESHEADHSIPFNAEVQKGGATPPFSHTSLYRSTYLSTRTTFSILSSRIVVETHLRGRHRL
jgi:hypothetical protein